MLRMVNAAGVAPRRPRAYSGSMSIPFTSSFAPAAGRRGYHHGNLREALIDAARFLIAEKGPQGFTLIEAARLADVSPAAPYRHFRDREQLIAAVAERGFALFGDRLKAAFERSAGGQAALAALGAAYLAFAREEPGHYGAMFLAARQPGEPADPARDDGFGLLVEAVRLRLASGVDPLPAALQIWTLAHGVASLSAGGQPRAPRRPSRCCAPAPRRSSRRGRGDDTY
jgi:AcrR family transcriptional regulator